VKKYLELLQTLPLFRNVAQQELEPLLGCLSARYAHYKKEQFLLLAGDAVSWVGIVLCGSVQVLKEDAQGNTMILTELGVGDLFAETFACAAVEKSPVTVVASADCDVLLIDYRRIITTCPSSCVFHSRLIENMLRIMAKKNMFLNSRIEIVSKRTTREKILAYLELQRGQKQSDSFDIPFSRQQLADFLCVERSALSRELSNMREEGLLQFQKNHFILL